MPQLFSNHKNCFPEDRLETLLPTSLMLFSPLCFQKKKLPQSKEHFFGERGRGKKSYTTFCFPQFNILLKGVLRSSVSGGSCWAGLDRVHEGLSSVTWGHDYRAVCLHKEGTHGLVTSHDSWTHQPIVCHVANSPLLW